MSHPYGPDNSGAPGLLMAWSKQAAEWVTPTLIEYDGVYTAKPAIDVLDAFKIDVTLPGTPIEEYFLIENRQAKGIEEKLWASGLLIVHIDDAAEGQKNRGYPDMPGGGWPGNGMHYRVAVMQVSSVNRDRAVL